MTRRLKYLLIGAASCFALAGCARRLPPPVSITQGNVASLRSALGGEKGAAAATAAAAEPTGFATIRGVFTLNGEPPPRQQLNIDKEREVCMPGGKPVFREDIVIDPATKGIKDVVIYLTTKYPAGNEKWEHPDHAATRDAVIDFDQKNCIFLTHVLAMRSTQKLRILNSDPVGHNTNVAGGGNTRPENATVPSGSQVLYSPGGESQQPFPIACNIHPWMSANGIVRNSPYFAVTDVKGNFEIQKVPAGVKLEFRVWQERAKFIQAVQTTSKIDKYAKGRLTLTLEPDEERELAMVVDAELFK